MLDKLKEMKLNEKIVEIAKTQILEYSQGYKDGLNKETTATAIVAREIELNFIRQEIKHKHISKDKIRAKIDGLELQCQLCNIRNLIKCDTQCTIGYTKNCLKELFESEEN